MKNLLLSLALVLCSFATINAQCTDVTVNLYDSYGDGGGEVVLGDLILTNSGSSNSGTTCISPIVGPNGLVTFISSVRSIFRFLLG